MACRATRAALPPPTNGFVGVDSEGVSLQVRADDHGDKRTTWMADQTFIGRIRQQVLPFEAPTLVQTGESRRRPVRLFGREF